MLTFLASLTDKRRLFYKTSGAATINARSPVVFLFVLNRRLASNIPLSIDSVRPVRLKLDPYDSALGAKPEVYESRKAHQAGAYLRFP